MPPSARGTEARDLPIICPHGHVAPQLLADDSPFPEPAALIVLPDHSILRMLPFRGLPRERLGMARRDGGESERDPRRIWQPLGEHDHAFVAVGGAAG